MAKCNRCGAVLGPKQFKYCSNRCQGLQRRERLFKQMDRVIKACMTGIG